MKYQPDRYICKIRQKTKEPFSVPAYSIGPPWFDSWEEAHAWLVADRVDKLASAKNLLKLAERTLANAQKMRNPDDR